MVIKPHLGQDCQHGHRADHFAPERCDLVEVCALDGVVHRSLHDPQLAVCDSHHRRGPRRAVQQRQLPKAAASTKGLKLCG